MPPVKRSKAFEAAGQSETRKWIGGVNREITLPNSLAGVPDTLSSASIVRSSTSAAHVAVVGRVKKALGR